MLQSFQSHVALPYPGLNTPQLLAIPATWEITETNFRELKLRTLNALSKNQLATAQANAHKAALHHGLKGILFLCDTNVKVMQQLMKEDETITMLAQRTIALLKLAKDLSKIADDTTYFPKNYDQIHWLEKIKEIEALDDSLQGNTSISYIRQDYQALHDACFHPVSERAPIVIQVPT